MPPLWLHLFTLFFVPIALTNGQQRSFAETMFDLPADLPPEDPPPIAANQDAAPSTAAPAPPPPEPAVSAPAPSPPPPPPAPPLAPPPTMPSTTLLPIPESTTANPKTPLPSLPKLIELPKFVQDGNVQPITVPPALIEPGNGTSLSIAATTTTIPLPSSNPIHPTLLPPNVPHPRIINAPVAKLPPNIGSISTDQQQRKKIVATPSFVGSWFKEEFNTKNCPKSAELVAKHFRRKFPRNLLRHGKDEVLADLLAARLKECLRKQRENFWTRLDKEIALQDGRDDSALIERDECRVGLVEEQIACMNVYSFACQFIQPTYIFRLLPTRIIVQEARFAEDGAEKCRKFADKLNNGIEENGGQPR